MSYDGNHNLTYDGNNTLTYDVENRVIQAENALSCASASPCTYLYDPLGERKQKTVGRMRRPTSCWPGARRSPTTTRPRRPGG